MNNKHRVKKLRQPNFMKRFLSRHVRYDTKTVQFYYPPSCYKFINENHASKQKRRVNLEK